MKAFDAYLDKQSRDGGFDLMSTRLDNTTNRSLSREMEMTFRTQFAERQKMTVASNYFALACPILPVGLLGIFMLLDRLDRMNEPQPHMTEADEVARNKLEASQQIYLLAMKQKQERETKKTPLSCSRPLDLLGKPGDKSKRKDIELQPDAKRSERISGPSLLSKAQNDVGKVVKAKMALEAHLDKMSGEQDYAMHCRVSAQLDLLDKALKRLGA
jgi:hypothetical protein